MFRLDYNGRAAFHDVNVIAYPSAFLYLKCCVLDTNLLYSFSPPAGAAGVLVGHPFDTVKVRLQVQSAQKPLYRGTFHCFQSIIRQESGNTMRYLGKDTPTNQFLAGAAAGAIQSVICCPMELAKTRMQMQGTGEKKSRHKVYKNSLDCLARIYRREGLAGVNRGMVSTLVRETPGFGVYFLAYDLLTAALGCEPEDPYMIPKLLCAGGMSGIASWLSTYPVDVIKSRLQADGAGGAYRYGGIADCVRQSVRQEGWRVFTRGLTSTLLRAFPVNAATFATVTLVLMYARGEDAAAATAADCEPAPAQHHLQPQAQAQPSSL
ncbi:mitochondrial basic amino acids transporter-like isoform X2 [Denticeps clupeoides]|uniref:mitochondrial basic amino acids transporter-like isoform X2 n=1 Tax=Denticeps clupeoides TaxID=299321 RepID=UPI0010A4CA34|nr:mitochondrial basic amino acids transporter-like isoform X2 [Denticeps clupeoides]